MSAEPDKTRQGEKIVWDLTHESDWTAMRQQHLEQIAEGWIREHEENAGFILTPGTPWVLNRDMRIGLLSQQIRDEFRYQKVLRPGAVTRRIQEMVNEYTGQWVSEDAGVRDRRRKRRAPSPRTALADARRLTPAPSRIPAAMQGIQISNTGSMDRTDTHSAQKTIE